MSVCQIEERDAGRPYPRTCPTCKLTGSCAKGLDRKSMAARIEALEAERDALAEKLDMMVHAATRLADLWDKDAMDLVGPATRQMRATLAAIKEGK